MIFALEMLTAREKKAVISSLCFYFQGQLLQKMLSENTSHRTAAGPPRN